MERINIAGETYLFFGKVRGSNNNKFNRVAKLAYQFDELDRKFHSFIDKGSGVTEHSRLALCVLLIMHSGIRVGNEGSAEGYMTIPHPNSKKKPEFVQTYGLTTLKKEHVSFTQSRRYANLFFLGKKQVENSFTFSGKLKQYLLQTVQNCETETLFNITAYQLTKFIKRYVGKQFSPKDFRTLRANMIAYKKHKDNVDSIKECVAYYGDKITKTLVRQSVKEIAEEVSEKLNNTVGVCKKSYIDDMLFTHHVEELEKLKA